MRAASTSSPSAISTIAASAPEVTSSSVGKVGHSACQGPALRSWSCTCAAKIVAARLGAMVAAASALAAATGLRLCGMVEEPPRPSPDGSKASPTSVCIISETSRAILPQVPAMMANTEAASAMRSRWVCQGASGSGSLSSCGQLFRDLQSLVAEGGQRAGRAAELQRQRLAAQALQPQLRAVQRRGIFGELQSERHRQRMLQPGAGDDRGMAVLTRQSGKACDGAIDVGEQRVDAGAQAEHGAGIDDVLAGRAPMHIARGFGIHLGDVGRQRLDERDGEVAGPGRGLGQRGEVE